MALSGFSASNSRKARLKAFRRRPRGEPKINQRSLPGFKGKASPETIWLVVSTSPGPKSCQRVGPRWPILGWLGLPFDSLLPWMRSLLHKPDSRLEFTLSLRSLACIVRWLGQSVACCLWRCCWPWTWLLQGGRSRQCLLLAWSEHVLVGRVSVGTSSCARICEDAMDGHCLHANFVRVCKPASCAWPSFLLSQCCGD